MGALGSCMRPILIPLPYNVCGVDTFIAVSPAVRTSQLPVIAPQLYDPLSTKPFASLVAARQLTFRRRQKEQAFADRRDLRGLVSAMESIAMGDGGRRMKAHGIHGIRGRLCGLPVSAASLLPLSPTAKDICPRGSRVRDVQTSWPIAQFQLINRISSPNFLGHGRSAFSPAKCRQDCTTNTTKGNLLLPTSCRSSSIHVLILTLSPAHHSAVGLTSCWWCSRWRRGSSDGQNYAHL